MSQLRRNAAKLAIDLTLWIVAALLAFPLRVFDGFADELGTMIEYAGVAAVVGLVAFVGFKLPRQSWREVSLDDLLRLLQAIGVAAGILFLAGLVWYEVAGFPRTVPLIQAALAVVFMGGTRLWARLSHERRGERSARAEGAQQRVLVVGAGSAGASMAREMRRHSRARLSPVGFLDDDPSKRGMSFAGLPVLGTIDQLGDVTNERGIDQVLIAMPSAPGRRTRRVVELAGAAGVPCRILPGVTEILLGDDVRLTQVRDVSVEDLLRRRPVELDLADGRNYIEGRTVLGHGGRRVDRVGAGAAGRAARPRAAGAAGPGRERPAHDPAGAAGDATEAPRRPRRGQRAGPDEDARRDAGMPARGGVPRGGAQAGAAARGQPRRGRAEQRRRHAHGGRGRARGGRAAVREHLHRQGRQPGLDAGRDEGDRRASRARTSPRGRRRGRSSSRCASATCWEAAGSVVPIFQEQIARGGPITVTHPDMTRFFMTIPEASRLVIQAGSFRGNGAVYVLDMGTPVRIVDLARDMIRLSGRDEDEIEIVFTGLRPGEKLAEELFTEQERTAGTRYEQILVSRHEPGRSARLRQAGRRPDRRRPAP